MLDVIYTLSMLENEYGEPDRRLAVGQYWAPRDIRVEGGRLYWHSAQRRSHIVKPTVETFTQFVDLSDGTEEDVLTYARRWGVLYLCKHLLPASHNSSCTPLELHDKGEPVSEWKQFALAAKAIWNIGEQLKKGRGNVGRPTDWDLLRRVPIFQLYVSNRDAATYYRRPEKQAAEEKDVLVEILNLCLEIGDVRPRMDWEGVHPALNLSGGSGARLFGALAIHLLEHTGGYEIAACTGCRRFFDVSLRERRPKSGQDRFCPSCIESGVPVRLAKQRVRDGLTNPRKRAK